MEKKVIVWRRDFFQKKKTDPKVKQVLNGATQFKKPKLIIQQSNCFQTAQNFEMCSRVHAGKQHCGDHYKIQTHSNFYIINLNE